MISLLAWLAVTLEMFGNWIIGDKHRWGFVIKMIGSVAWLTVAVLSGIHGLIASAILGFMISCRNFIHWRKNV